MSKNSVSDRAIRLVDYLTRLAYLRATTIRDVEEYSQILWIHEIPQEKNCFTQAWGPKEEYDDDIWLEIQTTHEPELPSVPDICHEWVNPDTLQNTNDVPKLLSSTPSNDYGHISATTISAIKPMMIISSYSMLPRRHGTVRRQLK